MYIQLIVLFTCTCTFSEKYIPPHLYMLAFSNDGRSPLFAATLSGHLDVLNKLIESGANVNLADKVCSGLELN